MKRICAIVVALGMVLPLIAVPVSCDSLGSGDLTAGQTFLKLFANPECLEKYGPLAGL